MGYTPLNYCAVEYMKGKCTIVAKCDTSMVNNGLFRLYKRRNVGAWLIISEKKEFYMQMSNLP